MASMIGTGVDAAADEPNPPPIPPPRRSRGPGRSATSSASDPVASHAGHHPVHCGADAPHAAQR